MFPFTLVIVKSEDEEEKPQSSQLHHRQTEPMETGADGEDCGGAEPERDSDPETEGQTEDCSEPETEDSDDWGESKEHQSGLISLKNNVISQSAGPFESDRTQVLISDSDHLLRVHRNNHTGGKCFSASACKSQLTETGILGDTPFYKDEHIGAKQEDPNPPPVKEEQEEVCISHASAIKFLFYPVTVKSEDDEEKPQSSQLHHKQTEQMETGADGEDCGGAEPERDLDPERRLQLETEVKTEDSDEPETEVKTEDSDEPETEVKSDDFCETDDSVDSDFWKETRERRPGLNPVENAKDKKPDAEKKSLNCSECGKTFRNKNNLTQHMRIHTGEKPYSCSECNKSFNHKSYLKLHIAHHSGEKPFNCSFCDQSFSWYYQLKKHKCFTVQTSEPFQNQTEEKREAETGADEEDCGGKEPEPPRNSDPDRHLQPEAVVEIEESGTKERDNDWKDSRKHKTGLISLKTKQIKRPKTGKKSHTCTECGKPFKKNHDLTRHLKFHTGEKPFSCSVCRKIFNLKKNLKSHMLVHTGEKPFSCSVCTKRFNHKSSLKLHMVHHEGEKPFSCSLCSKRFNQKGHLNSHMLVHTQEKPFSCSQCSKRFNHKSGLTVHMAQHKGVKPFNCSLCSKRFHQKGHLTSHMLVHTGEKPFSCSLCSKRFSHKGNLSSHMLVHTGEKPFSCSFCSKRFTLNSYLILHVAHHRGEKPYSCNVCEKRFPWRYQLKKHKCVLEPYSELQKVKSEFDREDCEGTE